MTKIIFKILKMHCTSCSVLIDTVLEELKGIKSAKTSYANQTTEVEYDPSQITPEKMIETIKKEGYDMKI